jgi:hypothetical protein
MFKRLPEGEKLYRHTVYPLLVRREYRLERMTEAVLSGSAAVHNWVRIPWHEHWRPYERAGVPIVRYEDLLTGAEREGTRILHHLGIERSPNDIARAVQAQSFAMKKQMFLEKGETGRARFLRVGKSEQWRTELPQHLQTRFVNALASDLEKWGYPIR